MTTSSLGNVYTNVAEVIAATPAGQILTVKSQLLTNLGNPETAPADAPGGGLLSMIPPATLVQIRDEIDAAFDAIAAAPTA